jgi:hypothetical protein
MKFLERRTEIQVRYWYSSIGQITYQILVVFLHGKLEDI